MQTSAALPEVAPGGAAAVAAGGASTVLQRVHLAAGVEEGSGGDQWWLGESGREGRRRCGDEQDDPAGSEWDARRRRRLQEGTLIMSHLDVLLASSRVDSPKEYPERDQHGDGVQQRVHVVVEKVIRRFRHFSATKDHVSGVVTRVNALLLNTTRTSH